MAKRATITDVAKRANVGVATVDRVLNGRLPVRPQTAQRVAEAIKALNYHAHGLMRRRLEEMAPAKTLGFILQKETKWFYRSLAEELERGAKGLRGIRADVEIAYVNALSPPDLASALRDMSEKADAIGLVAVDHPEVNGEIDRLADRGIPAFAMLSDLGARSLAGFVGIDGAKAGRAAAWMMSRLCREDGEIAILVGSRRYVAQDLKERGFRAYMSEKAPGLRVRESPLVYLDDRAVAYEAALELLRDSPRLSGIYHCGGGVRGALRAIRESGAGEDIVYACHDASPEARAALADGTVDFIVSNPVAGIARACVELMEAALLGAEGPRRAILPFEVLVPESI